MRSAIDALKARLRPHENPYFTGLLDGSFAREDFVETQLQFLHAVVFFSRPMLVLAARLPSPEARLSLLANVLDEHGRGDLSLSHERTFLALLARLGVSRAELDRRALWPEVQAFNAALAGVCAVDDVPTALAALGIIEELFSELSGLVGRGILARGWLAPDELVHYPAHERLDLEHAEGFYRWIAGPHASGPRVAYQVEQGLALGAHLLLRLYEELHRARERRAFRAVTGPHGALHDWRMPDG